MELTPWRRLFSVYIGPYSSSENDRSFRAHFGVHPQIAEHVFLRYQSEHLTRFRLMIVLHFLKVYPTQDTASNLFKLSRPIYRKILWSTVKYLDSVMLEISLDNRFEGFVPTNGLFKDIALVVDGTDIPIEKPNGRHINSRVLKWLRRCYYAGREKDNMRSRYCFKYNIGVQISTGKICHISGPFPGSKNDIRILRESGFMEELRNQDLYEVFLADKGYEGLTNCLSPIKERVIRENGVYVTIELTPEEEAFNEILASVRFIVECTLGRVKIFNVLNYRYRKGWAKSSQHKSIFNICCQITNLSLEREPLSYSPRNFYLY
jgi:Mg2+ and Co2+ transporter CorA